MDMKIKGYADPFNCFQEGDKKPSEEYCEFAAATLVVHPGPEHEEVFTKSEVEKIRELIPYVKHEKNCYLKRPDAILDGIGCTCGLQEKLDALTKPA